MTVETPSQSPPKVFISHAYLKPLGSGNDFACELWRYSPDTKRFQKMEWGWEEQDRSGQPRKPPEHIARAMRRRVFYVQEAPDGIYVSVDIEFGGPVYTGPHGARGWQCTERNGDSHQIKEVDVSQQVIQAFVHTLGDSDEDIYRWLEARRELDDKIVDRNKREPSRLAFV